MKIGVDLSKADWVWRGVERSALLRSALPEAWRACLQRRATGYFEVAGSQFSQIVLFSDGTWFALAPPNPRPSLSEEWAALDWCLPEPLQRLYKRCDGAGPLGHVRGWPWRHGLLPVDEVSPLTSRMRFGEENILYQPAAWWAIARELNGNVWCCNTATGGLEMRLWDSGSHRLGPERSWDQMLSELSRHW